MASIAFFNLKFDMLADVALHSTWFVCHVVFKCAETVTTIKLDMWDNNTTMVDDSTDTTTNSNNSTTTAALLDTSSSLEMSTSESTVSSTLATVDITPGIFKGYVCTLMMIYIMLLLKGGVSWVI
jgi:hypothetical protein